MKNKSFPLLAALLLGSVIVQAAPLGTAFTYQGRLDRNGLPATNGVYGFQFALYDASSAGSLLGTNLMALPVTNGLFTTSLDFGPNAFNGEARWLEIGVKTNTGFVAEFAVLLPRTRIHPAPYALRAVNANTANSATSVTSRAVSAPGLATDSAPAAGQVLAYNGTTLVWQNAGTPAGAWGLTGNSPAPGNFLGTVNNQPLEVRVNNARIARLEPTVGAPNVILGRSNNAISVGVIAGTIGGGEGHFVAGNHSTISGGNANSCGSNAAFVGGGTINHANGSSSTLGGGYDNTVGGAVAFIGGGARNRASSNFSAITGGENNAASSDYAAVGGGSGNLAGGFAATVGGGQGNGASGVSATVAGGFGNSADGLNATIPGGANNSASAAYSFAAGRAAQARHEGSFVWADVKNDPFLPGLPEVFESTTSNQFSVRAWGGVRFETQFLQVSGTGNERAYLGGDGNGSDVQVGSLNPAVVNVTLYNAGNNTYMNLGARDVSCRVLTIHGGADLAEPFPVKEEKIEKGSVVVIDDEHPGRLKRSTMAYDTRVAGIVSGANGINPGIALKQEGVLDQGENVALTGRVYVQADASYGSIKPGDLLTTSDTPGHAMRVADHARAQGAILGKAMSALADGKGLVLVLVTLQ